jgi:hypothetical protein
MLATGSLGWGVCRAVGGVHLVDAPTVFERAGRPGFRVALTFVTGLALVAGVLRMCIRAAVVPIGGMLTVELAHRVSHAVLKCSTLGTCIGSKRFTVNAVRCITYAEMHGPFLRS